MIIQLALSDDPRGLIVDDGTRAILTLAHALQQRERLSQVVHERALNCRSMLHGDNEDLLQLLACRRSLAAWDHDYLFDGFIAEHRRGDFNRYVIGHEPRLPLLNLNAVLHHRFVTGRLSAAAYVASFAYVAHCREGLAHLLQRMGSAPRQWHPQATAILVCPRGCPGVVPLYGDLQHACDYAAKFPETVIIPALVEALLDQLHDLADALGVRVELAARSEHLLERLATENEASQTLLLAHQQDGWIHLVDRAMSIAEVYEAAGANLRGGGWYLAVCGADGPGQLAGALQARNRPFIVTGGLISIMQDQLGFMLALLEAKLRCRELTFESAIRHVQIRALGS